MIVHNGIIENFAELREFLKENDIKCISQTDTEVIVNLLAHHYNMLNNDSIIQQDDTFSKDEMLKQSIIMTCEMLEGT